MRTLFTAATVAALMLGGCTSKYADSNHFHQKAPALDRAVDRMSDDLATKAVIAEGNPVAILAFKDLDGATIHPALGEQFSHALFASLKARGLRVIDMQGKARIVRLEDGSLEVNKTLSEPLKEQFENAYVLLGSYGKGTDNTLAISGRIVRNSTGEVKEASTVYVTDPMLFETPKEIVKEDPKPAPEPAYTIPIKHDKEH